MSGHDSSSGSERFSEIFVVEAIDLRSGKPVRIKINARNQQHAVARVSKRGFSVRSITFVGVSGVAVPTHSDHAVSAEQSDALLASSSPAQVIAAAPSATSPRNRSKRNLAAYAVIAAAALALMSAWPLLKHVLFTGDGRQGLAAVLDKPSQTNSSLSANGKLSAQVVPNVTGQTVVGWDELVCAGRLGSLSRQTGLRTNGEFLGVAADEATECFVVSAIGSTANDIHDITIAFRVQSLTDVPSAARLAQAGFIHHLIFPSDTSDIEFGTAIGNFLRTQEKSGPIERGEWRRTVKGMRSEGMFDLKSHLGTLVMVKLERKK